MKSKINTTTKHTESTLQYNFLGIHSASTYQFDVKDWNLCDKWHFFNIEFLEAAFIRIACKQRVIQLYVTGPFFIFSPSNTSDFPSLLLYLIS